MLSTRLGRLDVCTVIGMPRTRIKETGIAYREDHSGREDLISVAGVEEIECMVNGLMMEGKLPTKRS